MATANLFLITDSLRRLLDLNVRALLRRIPGDPGTLNVTTMPPERNLQSATHTLNLHLYHALEDQHYRNDPTPGTGGQPIARQPLALSLFYILTAQHTLNEEHDAERLQLLFGLGIKTLHDFSRVDGAVRISPDGGPPQRVMATGLDGVEDRFEIAPRPLTPEESMAFWTAEQTATTRLSAYYEVRTVFIEPELPTGLAGRVYDLGLYVGPNTAPVLETSASLMVFDPPTASGLPPQVFETSPARAVLDPGSATRVNRVRLTGAALTGDGSPGASRIVLRTPAWGRLTPPVQEAEIDPAANALWTVEIGATEARFDLQGSLQATVNGVAVSLEVSPGIYDAAIRTTRRQITNNGVARSTTSESNQIAFSIGPHITQVTGPNVGTGRMVVQVSNTFDMTDADLRAQLLIDGAVYDEVASFVGNALEDAGSFVRQIGQVEFHPLFDPAVANEHAIRLILNGAESQPFWFETP